MATQFLVVKNRAYSKLAAAIAIDATSLTVTAGEGANFPSTYPFHLTIEDEIVSCTNRSTDTLTIDRHQQSTSAVAHAKNSKVHLNITAKSITDLNTAVNTIEGDVPTYVATGDMRYASAAGAGAILTIGATDTIMSVQGGIPTWRSPADILTDLSGQAGATFAWNSQNLTGVGGIALNSGAVIDFNSGDATITHSTAIGGLLTYAGCHQRMDGAGQWQFRTALQYLRSDTDGSFIISAGTTLHLAIGGTNEIDITATTMAMKGNTISECGDIHFNASAAMIDDAPAGLTIKGGDTSGDFLELQANSVDATPKLKITGGDRIFITGNLAMNGTLNVGGLVTFDGAVVFNSSITLSEALAMGGYNITESGHIYFNNGAMFEQSANLLRIYGGNQAGDVLELIGSSSTSSPRIAITDGDRVLLSGNIAVTGTLNVSGLVTFDGSLNMTNGDIQLANAKKIQFKDTNSFIAKGISAHMEITTDGELVITTTNLYLNGAAVRIQGAYHLEFNSSTAYIHSGGTGKIFHYAASTAGDAIKFGTGGGGGVRFETFLRLHTTDAEGSVEGQIWYDNSENTIRVCTGSVDSVVLLTATQTLTNKTLTSPAINGTVSTSGLTMPAFTLGGTLDASAQNIDNVAIIYGNSTYLRIGDANTTQHTLNNEDDLMVTGKLEVGGIVFLDGAVTLGSTLNVAGTTTIDTALTGVIRADSGVLSVDTTALLIANLENPPIEDNANSAPTSEWAFDLEAVVGTKSRVVWLASTTRAQTESNLTTPISFTDEDLTAVVGANGKIALVKITQRLDSYSSGNVWCGLRKNGETPTHYPMSDGLTLTGIPNQQHAFLMVGLDTDEVYEYEVELSGTAQTDIFWDILGYIE